MNDGSTVMSNSPSSTMLDRSGPDLIDIGPREPKPISLASDGCIIADSQTMELGHISADENMDEVVDDEGPHRRRKRRKRRHKSMPSNRPQNIQDSNFNKQYQENPLTEPVELTADATPPSPLQVSVSDDEKQQTVGETETEAASAPLQPDLPADDFDSTPENQFSPQCFYLIKFKRTRFSDSAVGSW